MPGKVQADISVSAVLFRKLLYNSIKVTCKKIQRL